VTAVAIANEQTDKEQLSYVLAIEKQLMSP
jgi:hypothetical protein